MKILITENDGAHDIVVTVAATNLTSQNDANLISVGSAGVHVVDDTDAHQVGDVYTPAA